MPVHYAYDSRKLHQPLTRRYRFVAFVFVIGTIALALNGAQLYRSEWGSGVGAWSYWEIAALITAGIISLALLVLLISGQTKIGYPSYQYLTVTDKGIEWMFNAKKGAQSVHFNDIAHGTQDPRHLIIKQRDGTEVWLENYLLENPEEEWAKFMAVLKGKIELK